MSDFSKSLFNLSGRNRTFDNLFLITVLYVKFYGFAKCKSTTVIYSK